MAQKSVRDALIVTLPDGADGEPLWMRVADGQMVQGGSGAEWLAACGLARLPDDCKVMLVPPASLTALHWISNPDMPPRQGRAAARIAALSASIGSSETLTAAANENDDPARPHIVAVAARADMQHWLLWGQRHGIDPDLVVPAPLLLPEPEDGYVGGTVGGQSLLRGSAMALPAGDPLSDAIVGDARITPLSADIVNRAAIAALDTPPINLRQGDFAKRVRRSIDRQALTRMAVWIGFIALASLLISLIVLARYSMAAGSLDADSVARAEKILPGVTDATDAQVRLDARLAERGGGIYGFTGPLAGLFTAMQATPNVNLTKLSRTADGLLSAQLAAARVEDINIVLTALQNAGFTITATSQQDPGGRTLADITVRP